MNPQPCTSGEAHGPPEDVAAAATANGHTLRPMAGAFDETHACERCGARAYPMPSRRSEWIGWAIEFTCSEVQEIH